MNPSLPETDLPNPSQSTSWTTVFKNDRWAFLILAAGLLVQLVTGLTQLGQFHSDQYFQLIEMSLRQLGQPNDLSNIWEFREQIRPTLGVYLLSGYTIALKTVGITDVFSQLTILRCLMGIGCFLLFNTLILRRFSTSERWLLRLVLLIGNLSWCFPYMRTLYNSEMLSSLCFGGALLILDQRRLLRSQTLFATGVLLACAFFMRFQIAFAMLGLLAYLFLRPVNRVRYIAWLGAGAAVGLLINVGLDSLFYETPTLTPWGYFHAKILEGKAASFGESSFLFYWRVLLATLLPPVSIIAVGVLLYGMVRRPKDVYLLCILFFIVGHSLVGHKENRFLFPVLGLLPIGIGVGIEAFFSERHQQFIRWQQALRKTLYISLIPNFIILTFLMAFPYSQDIAFLKKLHQTMQEFEEKPTTIYCIERTPYQTQSGLIFSFYKNAANPSVGYESKPCNTDWATLTETGNYCCPEYNTMKRCHPWMLDQLEPIVYSSKLLWEVNRRLDHASANTIASVWILCRIKPHNPPVSQPSANKCLISHPDDSGQFVGTSLHTKTI